MAYQKSRRAAGFAVYPPAGSEFNAFKYTPLRALKVVILGQDPYHEPGEAMGLAFSVPVGTPIPPSLKNIYQELAGEYPGRFVAPTHGNLIPWARQGVLLLNATLTVEAGQAGSHFGRGWEEFTDAVIRVLNERCAGLVFMLWGKQAQMKRAQLDPSRHLVLCSSHPSPLSAHRGFFGCGHFLQADRYLAARGVRPIDWRLPQHLTGREEL